MAVSPSRSTFEHDLLAQTPRTKISSLSVTAMFFSTTSLFFHVPSDGRGKTAALAKGRFHLLVGVVSGHCLPQQETRTLRKGTNRSPAATALDDFCRLKKRALTKPAHFDFGPLPAIFLHNRSRKGGYEESPRRMRIVSEPGRKKGVWFWETRSCSSRP